MFHIVTVVNVQHHHIVVVIVINDDCDDSATMGIDVERELCCRRK